MIFVQQLFPHLVGPPHMKIDQDVDSNIEHKKKKKKFWIIWLNNYTNALKLKQATVV